MKVSFPAMRGVIGGRTYYSCMMQLSVIPKMFTFRDWAEFTPEAREQRILNDKRVPDIARYILENEDGYLFSSICASYKCGVDFTPLSEAYSDIGLLVMDFDMAEFVINDGQHRCAAIAAALKHNKDLGEEAISILLFPYENLGRVQQMFSDLNRNVIKTSRSLDILYDKRDPLSSVVLEACEQVPVFQNLVDKDAMSLPARSPKLFTLTALYDATKELLGNPKDDAVYHAVAVRRTVDFWTTVAGYIPDWQKVKGERVRALDLRQEKISAHSVVLRAIGAIGHELMEDYPQEWTEKLAGLTQVDWRKSNLDWENVCIVANSVVSNRQARVATRAYLKRILELDLTDVERRALDGHTTPTDNIALKSETDNIALKSEEGGE